MAALIPSASATGSGTMTLAGPSTNSNQTVTIPDATGTMMVSGNMPAFSAYQSSSQTISSGTYTKINLQTEEFDTANCFDSTTNYRFTPNVAGYYLFTFSVEVGTPTLGRTTAYIYKNGSVAKQGADSIGNATNSNSSTGAVLIYANGSTDYFELYTQANNGFTTSTGSAVTYYQGYLARAA